jgi:MoaA/NifB/PqqE/SkfB family radical SAM enzyme
MLRDSFCSSPWFHLRLSYNGTFHECRWFKNSGVGQANISNTSVMEFYNSDRMQQLRTQLLEGQKPTECNNCYYEDSFDKLSGRSRQLLKSGIKLNDFELTARTSPHYPTFQYSQQNHGLSDYNPTDLQIDLGNVCNSACIMCDPMASSRLEVDYNKLYKVNTLFAKPTHYRSWTQDPVLLEKFITELLAMQNIKYIHFLGGETLYDPAFYTICDRLIASGRAKDIIVGTTTNGTIYDQRVEQLIKEFKQFHLGISIESVTELNDYIRYPSKINQVKQNINSFLALRADSQLFVSLRITPNVFTISEIDLMFEYMIENHVIAESCNILYDPAHLRIELIPADIRQATIAKLDAMIVKYKLNKTNRLNIRVSDAIPEVIANTIFEYRQLLTDYAELDNAEQLRAQLVKFIKGFESIRSNSILDYAPQYTDFLRSYGY